MALIPPFFLDAVAAVGFPGPDDQPRYRATGFLYGRGIEGTHDPKKYQIFFVTNRHVFEGERTAVLRFNPQANAPAREYSLELLDSDGAPTWMAHPNPEIDIAVTPLNVALLRRDNIKLGYFQDDVHTATRSKAKTVGLSEGDGVFVLGFPLGLVGVQRNFIIVRAGAIARFQDCLESQSPTFLIDCSIFPGNSGGPVVSRPEALSIQGTSAVGKAYLLGVVASYVPFNDVAISSQTKRPRIIFEENSGLATVFPVDFIEETVNLIPSATAATAAAPEAPPPLATESPTGE